MSTPQLLDDDGTASMATPIMMSHHGFRRDLACFARALTSLDPAQGERIEALRAEWSNLRGTLHGHHAAEDGGLFPALAETVPALGPTIERLHAEHRRIDPLLERGDAAFGQLPATAAALAVVEELASLLDPHLALEEAELIPHLRGARHFPAPASAEEAELHAQGFAWAIHGVAQDVVEQLLSILPDALREKLPQARQAYASRCERVWGSAVAGATRTPIPDLA